MLPVQAAERPEETGTTGAGPGSLPPEQAAEKEVQPPAEPMQEVTPEELAANVKALVGQRDIPKLEGEDGEEVPEEKESDPEDLLSKEDEEFWNSIKKI